MKVPKAKVRVTTGGTGIGLAARQIERMSEFRSRSSAKVRGK